MNWGIVGGGIGIVLANVIPHSVLGIIIGIVSLVIIAQECVNLIDEKVNRMKE